MADMSASRDDGALFDLLEDLCNGQLDPERHARLQAHLKDRADAQSLYLNYLDMHLALTRLHRSERPRRAPVSPRRTAAFSPGCGSGPFCGRSSAWRLWS
jgi:hypothetical protein